ncbi:hypothetical protein PENTCL1PPCAC_18691 [Pristionchus entomophagus]|uniref:PDZ and LIM domain protein Zasp n=1 Tax=Pristionchus entomophagus TaxID=358040 RepID=A0AAV5TQ93_9BILA|nr:hypothetical protein PENTCL1PPCAC_18691 [Pristionchus entomophagus]
MGGETVTVRMARGDRSTSWGFGVTESDRGEVIIVNVVPGSLADRAGLRNGDILDILEGLNNLDLKATDRLLVTSRDRIELVVHRNTGASSTTAAGQARIWKPEITHDTHINKFQHSTHHIPAEQPPQVRVSLEHSNTTQVPQGFNASALPFNTDPRVKHNQYNSPLSLYSKQNAAEQYELQTSDLLNKMSINGARGGGAAPAGGAGAPSFRSETMRLIQEEAARGGAGRNTTLSSHPNPNNLPTCFVCTRPILGVMARAAGHDVHGDCLSCATCGSSLKNVGHHFIDDKFYCDVHGSQKKGLISRPAPAAAALPTRGPEPPKSFYQPDVISRRPLSVSPNPAVHHQTSTYSSTQSHLNNPKTAGPISPANRGVPTNPPFIATSRPVSPPSYAPPPPPATAPPTGGDAQQQQHHHQQLEQEQQLQQPLPRLTVNGSTVAVPTRTPSSSPRRTPRSPSFCVSPLRKQWPPPPGRHTIGAVPRYWDVAARRGPTNGGLSPGSRAPATAPLADLVAEEDAESARTGGRRQRDPRRRTVVQPQLVADAREAVRRAAAHKEELAKRDDEIAHRLQPPAIPKGINVIATRSEPLLQRPEPRQAQTQPAAVPASAVTTSEPQPRPISYVSEASTILSAPEVQIRPVSMVALPPPSTAAQEPPAPRPQSMFSPLLRVNSSPVPFGGGRTFVDCATSPNPPPAYDPSTKPAEVVLEIAVQAASRPHRRVDISKQPPPPKKTVAKKKVNGVTKKARRAEIVEVHVAPLTGVAPTHVLHRGNIAARTPSPLVAPPGAWASVAEVLDEADLGTEPRRSPEEALETPQTPVPNHHHYDARDDIPRVRRPVYLPLDFEQPQPAVPSAPRIAFDLVDDYEDSIVSSTVLRPEMRRIMRMVDDDCESQETNEDWRKVNLSLLDEEGQWERDLATVGELNRRMRESTDRDPCGDDGSVLSAVDEEDRRRAIESIERHQRTLERQQASLSVLLDSAITFLRGMDKAVPSGHPGPVEPEPVEAIPAPPPRAFIPTATLSAVTSAAAAAQARRQVDENDSIESLSSVLDELRTIGLPQPSQPLNRNGSIKAPQPPPRRNLPARFSTPVPPPRGSSFSRSVYESRSTTNNSAQQQQQQSATNGYGSRPANGGYVSPYTNGGSTFNQRNQVSSAVSTGRMQQEAEPAAGERVPFCESCRGAIRGPFVLANGKAWCPEHFICSNRTCARKLLECGFVEENGQKFCETCFEKNIAPKCAKCATAIVSDCLNALSKKWHPACFTCAHCQAPFGNAAFYLEQGAPYCEKDWNMLFTTKCVSCRFPIEAGDRWVEALGSAYHSNCFSCTRCRVNLEGESFYAKNGEPYCKAHA